MRIGILGHKQYATRTGGIEVMITDLVNELADHGHQVFVYDRRDTTIRRDYENTRSNVIVKDVPTMKGSLSAVFSSLLGVFYAKKDNVDVLHIQAEGPALVTPIAKLLGMKVVCTIHGLDWNRSKWGFLGRTYIKMGEWAAVHFADKIVVLNLDTQEYFTTKYGRKTTYIRNGIHPINRDERCSNEDLNELRDKTEELIPGKIIHRAIDFKKDKFILYIGRIVPEKQIELLLKAFKALDNEDYHLVIAGRVADGGEYGQSLLDLSRPILNVHFLDFVSGNVAKELYRRATVFCLPSNIEGMSIALLEALSAGCVCVVNDIPENNFSNYMIRSKESSVNGFVEALGRAIEQGVCEEGQCAEIREKYSVEAMMREYEIIYK